MSKSYDIAIVGGGPVGLTLATLLERLGVSVAVIDASRLVCQHPRATHVDAETMRAFQTLGFASWEPSMLRMTGWRVLHSAGAQVMFNQTHGETEQGWWSDYMFHQPDFESRLRGRLANSASAQTWFGWLATTVEDRGDACVLQLRDAATGTTSEIEATYVVGCDGARSGLRAQVADSVEDLHGTQRSLIVDVHPFADLDTIDATAGFFLLESPRPVTYLPIYPPMRRFEFMLQEGDDAAEFERPEVVYDLLSRWLQPGDYRILRTDVYEWHAHLVRGWRRGRLLLAGDAAHEMPPMLGQGLCSGIRDAFNLAWKLARVVQASSSDALLDTYETERSPHVLPLIAGSAASANMVQSMGDAPAEIEIPEEGGEPPVLLLGPGVVPGEAPSGSLWIQPRLPDGQLLDDATGYRFVVTGGEELLATTPRRWNALGAAVVPATEEILGWLDKHSASAVILRPDHYVLGVAVDAASLEALTLALEQALAPSQG